MSSVASEKRDLTNVYSGSHIGRITDVSTNLIGCRVTHDEQSGTIKFVGRIGDSSVVWIGVDWDNESRGRHNGSFRGVQYFRANGATSASFLKPEKLSLGTSLEEALVSRYVLCPECQILTRNAAFFRPDGDPNTGIRMELTEKPGHLKATLNNDEYIGPGDTSCTSPLTVELFTATLFGDPSCHKKCGALGAPSVLAKLRSASIPGIPMFRCLRDGEPESEDPVLWPSVGGQLGTMLPLLVDLDLSECLLSKWTELARICLQLPTLKSLTVSKNCLRLPLPPIDISDDQTSELDSRLSYELDSDPKSDQILCSTAFQTLHQFVAVTITPISWPSLNRVLSWMPALKQLCLAYNSLGDLPSMTTEVGRSLSGLLTRLEELDLTSIGLTNFSSLTSSLGSSQNLCNLLLNGNKISKLDFHSFSGSVCGDLPVFKKLTSLGLRANLLADWDSVNELARLPVLDNLIFSRNPVVELFSPETSRQDLVARLPRLKSLNHLTILSDERRGAELDFLKRYGQLWLESASDSALRTEFNKHHPVFNHLCDKYGPPDSGETEPVAKSLKNGLIQLSLVCEPKSPNGIDQVERKIPSKITINHLRTMVRRIFQLPARAEINMCSIGSRPGFTNVEVPLEADTRELGFYGIVCSDKLLVRWTA